MGLGVVGDSRQAELRVARTPLLGILAVEYRQQWSVVQWKNGGPTNRMWGVRFSPDQPYGDSSMVEQWIPNPLTWVRFLLAMLCASSPTVGGTSLRNWTVRVRISRGALWS